MKERKLILEQLDRKIIKYKILHDIVIPPQGWVFSIRKGLNMSLRQLGNRMGVTPQNVYQLEEREKNGTVTINVLKQVGAALNMKFVYGFIPLDFTLERMIEKKAQELATDIVNRTSLSMKLEDQAVSDRRIKKAIEEKAEELNSSIPGFLWD
jgi:predicted DNA-binding mobile mystery protein A